MATRWTTHSVTKTWIGSSSALDSLKGCQATGPPDTERTATHRDADEHALDRHGAVDVGPGFASWTVSTYHASSGPESSAR